MNPNTRRQVLIILAFIATFSLNACAGLSGLGGTSWKEEVLLHDGRKIIVERTLERGGRHEIGQRSGATKETLAFTMPGTNQTITWNDTYSEDIGSSNFNLLMLEIANGSAYLVASPMGCLSYNKWGRPNPPYVVFNYQGTAWSRIPLAELPAELTAPNLVISSPDNAAEKASGGVISVETIKQLNGRARRAEHKTIVREAIDNTADRCGEMISDGHGGWIGVGWFRKQPSYEACLVYCEREKVSAQYCPCVTLFKGK
jgi:hypothetical protein